MDDAALWERGKQAISEGRLTANEWTEAELLALQALAEFYEDAGVAHEVGYALGYRAARLDLA